MICQPQAAAHRHARTVECRFSPRAAVTLGYRQRDVLTGEPFTKDGRPVAHRRRRPLRRTRLRSHHRPHQGNHHPQWSEGCGTSCAGVPADGNRRYARTPHASWHATSWSSVARCAATGPGYSRRISSTCFIGVCSKPTLAQHLCHRSELLGSWTASRIGSINAAAWRSTAPSLTVLAR